jgi:hypothetical protein
MQTVSHGTLTKTPVSDYWLHNVNLDGEPLDNAMEASDRRVRAL